MARLEPIEMPLAPSLVERLRETFADVPGAYGMAVQHGPTGTRALLVLQLGGSDFYDAELAAMERLVTLRRKYPMKPIDVLCLTVEDAARFDLSPLMTVYSFA